MKQNKLLQKQISKYVSLSCFSDKRLAAFVEAVNNSYNAFERDIELAARASLISEQEYEDVYKKLRGELEVKKISIKKLKEAIEEIEHDSKFAQSENDDLPEIVEYLKEQINKRKEAEANLKDAMRIAEDSAKAKEVFLANMSHEIRTPMNAILGMAKQLSKTELNARQHFYLDSIQNASENLLIILNDILDLSKIEAGKLYLEKIGFDLKSVFDRVIQVFKYKAEEKGLNITTTIFDDRISQILIGDPYRLNQILLNLMSNAIKFTELGFIDLSCAVIEDNIDNQTIEIKVRDTGVGMDEEFLVNVFQKFLQEEKSTARKYGGTGLGMAICKQLIELMDGTIQVESKKNLGTVISLRLTLRKGSLDDLPTKKEININQTILQDKNILLVEDNEMNRLLATVILNSFGASVRDAHNGIEAIEALKKSNYDLILMDVQMPSMDGLEATHIIREQLKIQTPIIALTANALKGESEKCINAGMNDYLSKPFAEEELVMKIALLLDIKPNAATTNITLPTSQYQVKNKSQIKLSENEAAFNLDYLNEMCDNNSSFVQSMLNAFVNEAENAIITINTALQNEDVKSLQAIAHRLKSNLVFINANGLKDLAVEIEVKAQKDVLTNQLIYMSQRLEAGLKFILEHLNVKNTEGV